MKYSILFSGRRNGSIGAVGNTQRQVEAESLEEAIRELYGTHEHIHLHEITCQVPRDSQERVELVKQGWITQTMETDGPVSVMRLSDERLRSRS